MVFYMDYLEIGEYQQGHVPHPLCINISLFFTTQKISYNNFRQNTSNISEKLLLFNEFCLHLQTNSIVYDKKRS